MARTTTKMGLTSWNEGSDDYNYEQLANNWQLIDFHDHTPGRGVPVAPGGLGAGAVLQQNIAAGVVGSQHLSTQLTRDLGIGVNGRGSVQNSAAATVTTTGYTVLDQVSSLNVDAGALVGVTYQALWKVSSGGEAFASITVDGSGVLVGNTNGAPESSGTSTSTAYLSILATAGYGLASPSSSTANSSEVNGGQIVGYGNNFGGEVYIFFNTAGSYDIGVGFYVSASTYTATIQNRHLWVRTINFE